MRFIFTILTSQNKVQKLFNKNGQNEKACEVITENRMLFLPPHRFNEKFGNWDKLHHMVSNIRKNEGDLSKQKHLIEKEEMDVLVAYLDQMAAVDGNIDPWVMVNAFVIKKFQATTFGQKDF